MENIIRANKENIKVVLKTTVGVLGSGGVVAYPTESFYALGARFDDKKALKKLLKLKKRPPEKAIPLIAGDIETVLMAALRVDETSLGIAKRHWPGPLTLVLPAREGLPEEITEGGRVGIRVPGESFALMLAKETGYPITATSANPSGMEPALTAEEVYGYFGLGVDLIVDGGRTKGGLPSTILEAVGGKMRVIREGAIKIESPIALELKEAFDAVSPYIESHTSKVCPHCEKVCCIDRHGTYEKEDFDFIKALGEDPAGTNPKPPKPVDTEPCRYLGDMGCTLPRWKRPYRCTWYFCPPLLETVYAAGGRDYRRFVARLERLLSLRRRLMEGGLA